MNIFKATFSGSKSLKNTLRAMSRSRLAATSLASVLILTTTAGVAAYSSPIQFCEQAETCDQSEVCENSQFCETGLAGHSRTNYDSANLTDENGDGCLDPDSPSYVWISPGADFIPPIIPDMPITTFPLFTIPYFPVLIIPSLPGFTIPEIPVVTPPVAPPEATTPVTDPTGTTPPSSEPAAPENKGQYPAPVVRVTEEADGVRVSWDEIDAAGFFAYVIVFSETNPNPVYPNDSYYGSITDSSLTNMLVESRYITGGDYYFSVTALYNGKDIAIAGNAVKATMPSTPTPPQQPEGTYPAVSLNPLSYDGISMNVSWSKTADTTGFVGYKVVAATDDTTPSFPENGCAAFVKNADTTASSYVINGAFLAGKTYSVTVIAVYSVNGVEYNIPSNVQTIQF